MNYVLITEKFKKIENPNQNLPKIRQIKTDQKPKTSTNPTNPVKYSKDFRTPKILVAVEAVRKFIKFSCLNNL